MSNGPVPTRDVNKYAPPTGRASSTNGPGLGGSNYGSCGTQGSYDVECETSGRPGIGGSNQGMGTNRRG